ncbi:MAG: D-glycero-beta-D-manno-heptose 1,7-bisphosphate 7-phosphatase [Candidatus Altiarchaeota archaeon]
MNKAVFLDRDGTINKHTTGYVTSWKMFRFLPNSLEALRELARTDYKVIVVTNQSAVARGLMSRENLEDIHERMLSHVEEAGGRIDAIYVCAHHPDERCACRKPLTGLLELAKETFDLDLKKSWMVGDNTKDAVTGKKTGCRTILVETGYGGKDGLHKISPDYWVKDLKEAVEVIRG